MTSSHACSHTNASPRLALVLGSGGVRSAAAIGIADVLRRAGLRPDLVVGCSSGAIFGATVALDIPAAEALRMATALWSQDLTERKRWRGYAQLLAPRWAGFDESFSLRSERAIARRLHEAFGHLAFANLLTPLRVTATDAATGAPVVLTRGPLTLAIQASIAVPFLFPSVEFAGQRLMDGVISDPLPLSAAADADVVVALGFRGAMPRRVNRASRLVARVSTALTNNLYDARLDAARARGQRLIELEIVMPRYVGLWDTSALPEACDAGARAAEAALPAIRRAIEDAREHAKDAREQAEHPREHAATPAAMRRAA
jgi:NTE family protein